MKNYVMIHNFLHGANTDYKGLSLDNIIAGSQLNELPYLQNKYAFQYEGEVLVHDDIEIITTEVYNKLVSDIEAIRPPSIEKQIEDINLALANMMGA